MPRARKLFITIWLTIALTAVALMPAFNVFGVNAGNDHACTPGFWKNHTAAWEEYSPSDTLSSVFGGGYPQSGDTMLQALKYGGGSGIDGARRILLRHAVASVLNAAHEGLAYPLRRHSAGVNGEDPIIPTVSSLLTSGTRDQMLAYASFLDGINNRLDCPLGGPATKSKTSTSF